MISRLLKIIGLFCKRAPRKRPIFSKERYNFKEPTNRSHPIPLMQEISLEKIMGLSCKRALLKRLYSAKETYDFREPTNCSHPIPLTEEIRFQLFGSPDLSIFLTDV